MTEDELQAIEKQSAGIYTCPCHFAIPKLTAEVRRLRAAEISVFDARAEGWQDAHNAREECGHPCACWQDENWPESERNYNPETKTSDPPIKYRCIMCEAIAAARAEMRERCAVLVETVEPIPCPDGLPGCEVLHFRERSPSEQTAAIRALPLEPPQPPR